MTHSMERLVNECTVEKTNTPKENDKETKFEQMMGFSSQFP